MRAGRRTSSVREGRRVRHSGSSGVCQCTTGMERTLTSEGARRQARTRRQEGGEWNRGERGSSKARKRFARKGGVGVQPRQASKPPRPRPSKAQDADPNTPSPRSGRPCPRAHVTNPCSWSMSSPCPCPCPCSCSRSCSCSCACPARHSFHTDLPARL